jgi:hypothetical protein
MGKIMSRFWWNSRLHSISLGQLFITDMASSWVNGNGNRPPSMERHVSVAQGAGSFQITCVEVPTTCRLVRDALRKAPTVVASGVPRSRPGTSVGRKNMANAISFRHSAFIRSDLTLGMPFGVI